jgi:hypothetical protein
MNERAFATLCLALLACGAEPKSAAPVTAANTATATPTTTPISTVSTAATATATATTTTTTTTTTTGTATATATATAIPTATGTVATATPTATAEPPAPPCDANVPKATLDALLIANGFNSADVVAGDTLNLELATRGPGPWNPFHYVRACAKWSVAPAGLATVDDNGEVVIGAGAAGKTITVSAKFANGRVVSTTIAVTKAEMAALVGNWKEDARQACGSAQWVAPQKEKAIRELHVSANGTFTVTWMPFESYVDYRGTFTWDASTGAMSLSPAKVNYLPADVVAKGTAKIEGGKLVLRGLWLGSAKGLAETAACAQRFQK